MGTLAKWPVSSEATGIVLASTDASYTSTDVYFYNFGTGALTPLATGESGDVAIKWDYRRLWLFNRASGRTSYSVFSPKIGSASRTVERRTPGANAFDPTDWLSISDDETIMAHGASYKVTVANLSDGTSLTSDLGDVDTSSASIPFRPGLLAAQGANIAVFHQALNSSWKAQGGGKIFFAHKGSNARWVWIDQNVTIAGIQGLSLNISNPFVTIGCRENSTGNTCLVAGACYSSMGSVCIGGVDQVTWDVHSVRHLFDWPRGYEIAGSVVPGAKSGQIIACLKSASESTARLVVMDSETGVIGNTWDAGAAFCGPIKVDQIGGRIFAIRNSINGSQLFSLSPDLVEVSHVDLEFVVSSVEVVNE